MTGLSGDITDIDYFRDPVSLGFSTPPSASSPSPASKARKG